jgi:hypothetical protein
VPYATQDFIVSARRSRLTAMRASMLVYVYANVRALAATVENDRGSETLAVWQLNAMSHDDCAGFPFPDREWEPNTNWGSSDSGPAEADKMFDDDDADEAEAKVEQQYDEENEIADDWAGASTQLLRPCPQEPLREITLGDAIVVWFGGEFNDWYEGRVTRIQPRSKLPVRAMFADGEASFDVVKSLYGVTGGREWALLQEMTDDTVDRREVAERRPAAAGDFQSDCRISLTLVANRT